jgi:hypothetical protein
MFRGIDIISISMFRGIDIISISMFRGIDIDAKLGQSRNVDPVSDAIGSKAAPIEPKSSWGSIARPPALTSPLPAPAKTA